MEVKQIDVRNLNESFFVSRLEEKQFKAIDFREKIRQMPSNGYSIPLNVQYHCLRYRNFCDENSFREKILGDVLKRTLKFGTEVQ